MAKAGPQIFSYDDYRRFLSDWFRFQKGSTRHFSQRWFAQRAGFKTHSFCSSVVRGEKNLSPSSIERVAQALSLDAKEAEFFQLLVCFNQAESQPEKERLFRDLNRLRKNTSFFRLNRHQYAYFEEWFIPVLRELAVYLDFNEDFEWLASTFYPPISPAEARKALKTLLALELLQKRKEGGYRQTTSAITAEDLPPHFIRLARDNYLRLALRVSGELGPDERHLSAATVALGPESFQKVSRMLDDLRQTVVSLATEEAEVDRVFQLNLQFFPVTGKFGARAPSPSGAGEKSAAAGKHAR